MNKPHSFATVIPHCQRTLDLLYYAQEVIERIIQYGDNTHPVRFFYPPTRDLTDQIDNLAKTFLLDNLMLSIHLLKVDLDTHAPDSELKAEIDDFSKDKALDLPTIAFLSDAIRHYTQTLDFIISLSNFHGQLPGLMGNMKFSPPVIQESRSLHPNTLWDILHNSRDQFAGVIAATTTGIMHNLLSELGYTIPDNAESGHTLNAGVADLLSIIEDVIENQIPDHPLVKQGPG